MGNLRRILHSQGIKTAYLLCGLVFLLPFILSGCKKDPQLAFIQGEWYYKDAHLANIPGESAQETSWVFDNGYFSVGSCCFVKSYFSGYYVVTDRKESTLNLELYHLKGQNGDAVLHKDDTLYAEISLNTEADTLTINSKGPYTRIKP